MKRFALSFLFGACLASPVAAWLATMPIQPNPVNLQAAIYTASEDGKIVDAVTRAHRAPIELETITIVGRSPKVAFHPKPKAPSAPVCTLHRLEMGGSPSAPFVLACG